MVTPPFFHVKNNVCHLYMEISRIYNLNIVGYLALFIICFIHFFRSDNESMSLLLLFTFHSFFTIFIFIFKSYIFGSTTITNYIFYSLFAGNILSFISLLLVAIAYSHLYNEYKVKNDEKVPLSNFYVKKMKIFKILYITSISIILSILFLSNFENNDMVKYVSAFLSTSLLGVTGYSAYNSNIILKLLDKTAIK